MKYNFFNQESKSDIKLKFHFVLFVVEIALFQNAFGTESYPLVKITQEETRIVRDTQDIGTMTDGDYRQFCQKFREFVIAFVENYDAVSRYKARSERTNKQLTDLIVALRIRNKIVEDDCIRLFDYLYRVISANHAMFVCNVQLQNTSIHWHFIAVTLASKNKKLKEENVQQKEVNARLCESVRNLEMVIHELHIDGKNMNDSNTKLDKEVRQLRITNEQLGKRRADLEEENKALKSEIAKQQVIIADKNVHRAQLNGQNASLRRALNCSRMNFISLLKEQTESEKENSRLKRENARLQALVNSLAKEQVQSETGQTPDNSKTVSGIPVLKPVVSKRPRSNSL